jgi:uncharacterized UPF0160 family protein
MAHTISDIPSDPTNEEFKDLMQHADDFFKIELLRQAKNWYKKALELNIETDRVKHQIAECDRLLAYENKIVKILGGIATITILIVVFLC